MASTVQSTDAVNPGGRACAGTGAGPAAEPMHVELQLTREPIRSAGRLTVWKSDGRNGAWVEFSGVVRGEEDGRHIRALEYEAYEPMALKVMQAVLSRLGRLHPCAAVGVIHRIGIIPVGETAIWVGVASRHRAAALALVAAFMEELKRDVPIWKRRPILLGSGQETVREAR